LLKKPTISSLRKPAGGQPRARRSTQGSVARHGCSPARQHPRPPRPPAPSRREEPRHRIDEASRRRRLSRARKMIYDLADGLKWCGWVSYSNGFSGSRAQLGDCLGPPIDFWGKGVLFSSRPSPGIARRVPVPGSSPAEPGQPLPSTTSPPPQAGE